jgi:organic radical activating enzyme
MESIANTKIKNSYFFNSFRVVILISKKCNFYCDHCNVRKLDWLTNKEISSETLNILFEKISKIDHENKWICLYGGEPTLNIPKMKEIVSLAKKQNFRIKLFTNCWWYNNKDIINEIKSLKIDYMQTSYDRFHSLSIDKILEGISNFDIPIQITSCEELSTIELPDNVNILYQKVENYDEKFCNCPKLGTGFILLPNNYIYLDCEKNYYFTNENCWKPQHINNMDFVKEFKWMKNFKKEKGWYIDDRHIL